MILIHSPWHEPLARGSRRQTVSVFSTSLLDKCAQPSAIITPGFAVPCSDHSKKRSISTLGCSLNRCLPLQNGSPGFCHPPSTRCSSSTPEERPMRVPYVLPKCTRDVSRS